MLLSFLLSLLYSLQPNCMRLFSKLISFKTVLICQLVSPVCDAFLFSPIISKDSQLLIKRIIPVPWLDNMFTPGAITVGTQPERTTSLSAQGLLGLSEGREKRISWGGSSSSNHHRQSRV